ncbi:MAG: hypothetical protein WBE26_08810 [Phycisphaerae bacterium]
MHEDSTLAKWTREKIIREILRREAAGLPLSLGGSKRGVESNLYQAGSRVFGSWGNAVKAALKVNSAPARRSDRGSFILSLTVTRCASGSRTIESSCLT